MDHVGTAVLDGMEHVLVIQITVAEPGQDENGPTHAPSRRSDPRTPPGGELGEILPAHPRLAAAVGVDENVVDEVAGAEDGAGGDEHELDASGLSGCDREVDRERVELGRAPFAGE